MSSGSCASSLRTVRLVPAWAASRGSAPSQLPTRRGAGSLTQMDRPPPDPRKLLDHWEEWERGETPPGRVMSDLKTGGLRELLRDLAATAAGDGPES